jgi:sphingosine kinase
MSNEESAASNEKISSLLNSDAVKVKFRRHTCCIQLTSDQFIVSKLGNTNKVLLKIEISDIIGAAEKIGKNSSESCKLEVYYYPLAQGCCVSHSEGNMRVRKVILLDFMSDSISAVNWKNVFNYVSSGQVPTRLDQINASADNIGSGATQLESSENKFRVSAPKSRNIIVIVNPVGGKRLGMKIWKRFVEPMLKEANVTITHLITEYANHGKAFMQQLENPSKYCAVFCIGGDGVVFEVINGLISRPQLEEGGQTGLELLKSLPIVHIPGGTGNGLAKSVLYASHEACSPLNATFVGLRGRPQPLDLSRVRTSDGTEHISFLSLAWGLVADVDILSESMRCLGEPRLYIAAVYFMLQRNMYRGRLRMKLTNEDGALLSGNETTLLGGRKAKKPKSKNGEAAPPAPDAASLLDEHGWFTLENDFMLVWSMQTSHTSVSMHSGPGVRLNDGIFTIAVAEQTSRFGMIGLLLGIDSGAHFENSNVKIFRCTEFVLEPLTEKGLYSLDGEVVPYGLLEAKVLPAAATVLAL